MKGIRRDRLLRTVRFEETDILPYSIGIKPSLKRRLAKYYGGTDFEQRIDNHDFCSITPEWVREKLGEGRHISYHGSLMQVPYDPETGEEDWDAETGVLRVIGPALPEPTLRGFSFPDPQSVELTPYPEKDGLIMLTFLGCMETASCMRGFARTWMDFVEHPVFLGELMDAITDFHIGLIDRARGWDVDTIMYADDWGSQKGLLISPDQWRLFIKPRMNRVVRKAREQNWLVALHSDGDISEVIPDLVDMGVNILHPVQADCMDVCQIKRVYGANLCLHGGLSNQRTIPFGTPDDIRREVYAAVEQLGKGGGYILSTGKEMRSETPVENAVALIEAVLEATNRSSKRGA